MHRSETMYIEIDKKTKKNTFLCRYMKKDLTFKTTLCIICKKTKRPCVGLAPTRSLKSYGVCVDTTIMNRCPTFKKRKEK